jgi:hypothetical protein
VKELVTVMMGEYFKEFFGRLSAFRKVEPVDSVQAFGDFLAGRAAYVSQKKLYEYVKQRMGLSYPSHFRDADFIASLNIAKWHVYAACLSDLAIWMGAQIFHAGASPREAAGLSTHAFHDSVMNRFDRGEFTGDVDELIRSFVDRAALAGWAALGDGEAAFRLSPKALVKWAPISDELKRYDTEIVINSLRFAWLDIREQYRKAIDADAVLADWRSRESESVERVP